MKKIFFSVGLVATGAAGWSGAYAQSMEAGAPPKIWNVSASLRGFYDDNYTVANNKKGSFGFEFTPSVSANIALRQTDLGIRYTFGMFYYVQRDQNGMDAFDYTHQMDLWLDHAFNERWKLNVTDGLAVGQDPKLVQGGAVVRVSGNNLANRAKASLNTEWTQQFSTDLHYGNNFFQYQANSDSTPLNPSSAALLNRVEENAGIDLQWHIQPETVGFIGYNYSWVRYTGNAQIAEKEFIITPPDPIAKNVFYYSNSRDNNTHYGYVGISHQITPNLRGSVRGGVSDTEIFNDPISPSSSLAPYADLSLIYTYFTGCYFQAGFTHDINSTDVATPNATTHHLTQYQESSMVYLDINHRFNSRLSGSINGQYQFSTYKDGAYSGKGDTDFGASVHLNYQFNRYLSGEVGYNFDQLISEISARGNVRNRIYLGLTANY